MKKQVAKSKHIINSEIRKIVGFKKEDIAEARKLGYDSMAIKTDDLEKLLGYISGDAPVHKPFEAKITLRSITQDPPKSSGRYCVGHFGMVFESAFFSDGSVGPAGWVDLPKFGPRFWIDFGEVVDLPRFEEQY